MSFSGKFQELRKNPDTAKACTRWTPAEDEELAKQATSHMDFVEIAKQHQRTLGSIKSRIMSYAVGYITQQNVSIEDAAAHFNLDVDELIEHKKRTELKQEEKQDDTPLKKKEKEAATTTTTSKSKKKDRYMDILVEIRDLLKVIAAK